MTGCASSCGSCADVALQVLRDAQREQRFPLRIFPVAA
jgi:bacterioferritin-associated ferredoxin